MAGSQRAVGAVYLLIDRSGSTVRGWAEACTRALPLLVDAVGREADRRFSLLAYGTGASVMVRLSAPADIDIIPPLVPDGLSSLRAGFALLARCISEDAGQLAADGISWRPPVGIVLADGLPTDQAEDLLAARDLIDGDQPGPVPAMHAIMPGGTDRLAVAGLRMAFHPLAPGSPAAIADAMHVTFQAVLGG